MKCIVAILLMLPAFAKPQSSYIIKFTDKQASQFSIHEPWKFLSARAIERRKKYGIPVTETDLPVVNNYIRLVEATGVKCLNASKWLNQIAIESKDTNALLEIQKLPFVVSMTPVKRISSAQPVERKFSILNFDREYYGNSFAQIHIHKGEFLHQKGFRGNGLMIAIIDAGFYHYQSLPVFDSINMSGGVYDTYDFVAQKKDVNQEHPHGMHCFSIMAANIPDKFVGTSPKATYLLYRSEDDQSESPLEEQNWIAAVERADSTGADIISTSLGYNIFDNPQYNYSATDLDGQTTMMAKAATIAAEKGMLLLVAAGNAGASTWRTITTPADATGILTVGAVDSNGNAAKFTSVGPTADGRLAPTVASVGLATKVSATDGTITTGNGTSFATPNLAGLVACLWQAFPEFTNAHIIAAIQNSCNNKENPDYQRGYGIPDFRLAYQDLEQQRKQRHIHKLLQKRNIVVYPNPVSEKLIITLKPLTSKGGFYLYNATGQLIFAKKETFVEGIPQEIIMDLPPVPTGIYILRFLSKKEEQVFRLIVQQ